MTFGEKLDEAIVMRGMKQREFAKAVGTSEVSISRYISNERNPKIQTAVKMANILNVSLDWLCGTASEKKSDGIALYQQGWNDAIDAMQNAKFASIAEQTEPQTDCYVSDLCKHYGDKQICGRCRSRNLFCEAELQPKTEPQTEVKGSEKWLKSSEKSDAPILTASGWKRIKETMPECKLILFDDDGNCIEPQTDCTTCDHWKERKDIDVNGCELLLTNQQTDCPWK